VHLDRLPLLDLVPHDDAVGRHVEQRLARQVVPAHDRRRHRDVQHARRLEHVELLRARVGQRRQHHHVRRLRLEIGDQRIAWRHQPLEPCQHPARERRADERHPAGGSYDARRPFFRAQPQLLRIPPVEHAHVVERHAQPAGAVEPRLGLERRQQIPGDATRKLGHQPLGQLLAAHAFGLVAVRCT
jgi:hypothetical protein